jgi:enamine deaminase RidA (YjgF/YER057c/UK114 family)
VVLRGSVGASQNGTRRFLNENLVSRSVFHVGGSNAHSIEIRSAKGESEDEPHRNRCEIYQTHPPVSTAVEVRRLVREEWLLEVEAIAVVPE